MSGNINNCCKPVEPCFVSSGFNTGRFAFVLVLFILLVIIGAACNF